MSKTQKELPGLEILGHAGTLEPEAYTEPCTKKRPTCPFKEFALQLTGESYATTDTRCTQSDCAWYNAEAERCEMVR